MPVLLHAMKKLLGDNWKDLEMFVEIVKQYNGEEMTIDVELERECDVAGEPPLDSRVTRLISRQISRMPP